MTTKSTDNLRSVATTETDASKASRAKRFHVIQFGDWPGFHQGFDTSAEAVAYTKGKGSNIVVRDTEQDRHGSPGETLHMRNWRQDHKWCPKFADA